MCFDKKHPKYLLDKTREAPGFHNLEIARIPNTPVVQGTKEPRVRTSVLTSSDHDELKGGKKL